MAPLRSDSWPPDEDLVAAAAAGERDAFGELVGRHQRRVWRVCRQYVGNDEADAAAQDSFVKAYSRLASFDRRSAFTTWLTRIAVNTCLDRLRQRKRHGLRAVEPEDGEELLARLPDPAADPERRAMERQAVRLLAAGEERLSPQQRQVVRLRFYAELELEEIAGALAVSVGTVKTQLHRAVHRLRQELGDAR